MLPAFQHLFGAKVWEVSVVCPGPKSAFGFLGKTSFNAECGPLRHPCTANLPATPRWRIDCRRVRNLGGVKCAPKPKMERP